MANQECGGVMPNDTPQPIKCGHPKRPELDALLDAAIKRGVTEEELQAQRRHYVASEAAWGSDADEAAYRAAHGRGDMAEMARLNAEGKARQQWALKYMRERGL